MKHSTLTKYILYCILDTTFSVRHISVKNSVERLHSFRVSLRLIRSLLHLYIDERALFPAPLKTFLKATNFVRELDVLLLSFHQKSSSQRVIKRLTALRNEHYKILFTKESTMQLLQELDTFYDLIANLNPTFTNDYLLQTAYEYYEKSLKKYTALTPSASQKELHSLRIRFKISRYASDFLHDSGLHDSDENIEAFKGIQDQLGEIHDLFNQITLLETLQEQNPSIGLKKYVVECKKELKRSMNALMMSNTNQGMVLAR